jgi:hypothetical protein
MIVTPSQAPSQTLPLVMQAGRVPAGMPVTGEQVPSAFTRLQAAHWSVQLVLQQTPSAQKPAWHWFKLVQAAPIASFAVQWPPASQ